MAASIERLVPPGDNPEQLQPPTVPDVRVGGFLNEFAGKAVTSEVLVPMNMNGKPMSPIEASTGVVLPVIAPMRGPQNRHHAHFYAHAYKNGSQAQQSLRLSRLQLVGVYAHTRVHKAVHGTAFPESPAEEYEAVVLNCAGYIPDYGLRVKKGNVFIDELNNRDKKILRRPHMFTQEGVPNIGRFLLDYALQHDFDDVKQLHVEEFLSLTVEKRKHNEALQQRKLRLAEKLTNKAISIAVDPINPVFVDAHKANKLRRDTPSTAWEVVAQRVDVKRRFRERKSDYLKFLENKLEAQFNV